MNSSFNLIEFVRIIWRWRKPVWIICAIATVGSVVITDPHIMKPYYAAQTSFYPLNPNLTSASSLFTNEGEDYFGLSADVDRVLSIAVSSELKMYLISKFHLFEHYKIDSAKAAYPMYDVLMELHDHYGAEKNDKGAIVLTVEDHDKQFAAALVNAALQKIDDLNREKMNDGKIKIASIFESKKERQELEVNELADSIFRLKREFNLYGTIEKLPSQMATFKGPNGMSIDEASERVKVLEESKKSAIRDLDNTTALYEQYKATISNDVPTLYVLEKAFPPERKSKPIRWMIVLGATLISFISCSLAVVLIERFKYFKAAVNNADKQTT